MDSKVAHKVCLNLRDPLDVKTRIHLTPRAIKMVCLMFDGRDIDVIGLHSMLLRVAYMKGSFSTKRHITMSDIATYILTIGIMDVEEVKRISDVFDEERDSMHGEVSDMKKIIASLSREEQ
jgi:hypothetical protein